MVDKGLVTVISGPSGAGKGTLLEKLRESCPNVRYSISATTRKPRRGEENGVNYFFKTFEEFKNMIENNQLLEWVEYCDNYYGTPKEYILSMINQGFDVVVEIDVEGAHKVLDEFPDCVSIFILPPSMIELRKRIENRGSETKESIEKRMIRAKREFEYAKKYDYVVVNDDVHSASNSIELILRAEKLKYCRNKKGVENILLEGLG